MNPVSTDIKDLLISSSSGLDLTFGTDLFISQMPETPDECVAIFDSPGSSKQDSISTENYETLEFQVLVRGVPYGYNSGMLLAFNIKNFLDKKTNTTIGGSRYIVIFARSEPTFVNYDESQRPVFSANFSIHRTY